MPRHDWVWIALLALAASGTTAAYASPPPVSPGSQKPMTLAELRALAASVGFPDPDLAAAVAMAESSGNPFAVGDDGHSFGLWQVNLPSHPEFEASRLLDSNYNAHAALLISRTGTDWSPWTTYRTGAYLQYMGGSA